MSLKKIITLCAVAAVSSAFLSGCAGGRSMQQAGIHYSAGVNNYTAGQNDMAIAELSEAIRLNPKSPMAYYYRGLAYQKMGNSELALADFERSLKLNPNQPDAKRRVEMAKRGVSPDELVFGTSVSAEFTDPNDEHTFVVRSAEAGRVTVETSGNLDTFIDVYDEENKKIAQDDDGGRNYNARVTIPVEAGKRYRINVREVDRKSGSYNIVANFREAPQPRQGPRVPVELTFGNSVTEVFESSSDVHTFIVKTPEAGRLTVETSGGLDTFMEVFDEGNNKIGEDDDGGRGTNARFTLNSEAGKTYTFKVNELDGDEGEYEIVANFRVVQQRAPIALTYGTSVSGTLDGEGDIHVYTVTPTASGRVIVETSGNLDTYMKAYNDADELIGENDDGGQRSNAKIALTLDSGRTYTYKIHELNGRSGSYQVVARFIPTRLRPAVALTYGTSVSANFESEGDIHVYTVKPTAHGRLTLETSGSLDTYIEAYDAANVKIGENDDGGQRANARLVLQVEPGKTYTYRVFELDGKSGAYQIVATFREVAPTPPVALSFGVTVAANFAERDDMHMYTVAPTQDGWVVVETSGGLDTFLEALDENNRKIGEDDDGGERNNARYVQRVEAGKKYSFKITELDGSTGSYDINATFHTTEPAAPARRRSGGCGGH